MITKIITEIKQSTVYFGRVVNNEPIYTGTGFLIQVDDVFYVVTAKHVVKNNFNDMLIFFNNKNFGINGRKISEILQQGYSWKSHDNGTVDISVLPFPINANDDNVKFVPNSLFIKDKGDIQELVDLFFLSYQPGINDFQKDKDVKINPIIRKGIVSRHNSDKTFYMDGFAFPGNSGSPVFLLPTPIKIKDNNVQIGGPIQIKLAGVIGAYVPYQDVAISQQTGQVRTIFTENTGLALVHSTFLLNEIIESADFQDQHKKLTKKITDSSRKKK